MAIPHAPSPGQGALYGDPGSGSGSGSGIGVSAGSNNNSNSNGNSVRPPPSEEDPTSAYTFAGVLHHLQSEWRQYERERNEWDIERAEMRARIALLEGERASMQNAKTDLMRRVKMLEFALRQERARYLLATTGASGPPSLGGAASAPAPTPASASAPGPGHQGPEAHLGQPSRRNSPAGSADSGSGGSGSGSGRDPALQRPHAQSTSGPGSGLPNGNAQPPAHAAASAAAGETRTVPAVAGPKPAPAAGGPVTHTAGPGEHSALPSVHAKVAGIVPGPRSLSSRGSPPGSTAGMTPLPSGLAAGGSLAAPSSLWFAQKDPKAKARSRGFMQQCLQEINYLTSASVLNPLPDHGTESIVGITSAQHLEKIPPRPRRVMDESRSLVPAFEERMDSTSSNQTGEERRTHPLANETTSAAQEGDAQQEAQPTQPSHQLQQHPPQHSPSDGPVSQTQAPAAPSAPPPPPTVKPQQVHQDGTIPPSHLPPNAPSGPHTPDDGLSASGPGAADAIQVQPPAEPVVPVSFSGRSDVHIPSRFDLRGSRNGNEGQANAGSPPPSSDRSAGPTTGGRANGPASE